MKVALVCIAKDEDLYIEEWINYNLKLGFNHIFIFENNWRCSMENLKVTKIPFDGDVKQTQAYNHFIQNYSEEYTWAAFFDVDEFLVLKKHKSVTEFMDDYKEFNGVGINWYFFGSNGYETITNEKSVLKRFTKRQQNIDLQIKTILKLTKSSIMSVHNPNVPIVDTNKKIFSGPFNQNGDDKIAQLNHYFTKSKSEFLQKISRGRADTPQKRNITDFQAHDLNNVEDLNAYKFLYDNNNLLNS